MLYDLGGVSAANTASSIFQDKLTPFLQIAELLFYASVGDLDKFQKVVNDGDSSGIA